MSTAVWAARYIERLNLRLTPLHGKKPYLEGWNTDEKLIGAPADARAHWNANPSDNIGACLAPSGLVSLDADQPEHARAVLAAEGIDLDELMRTTPTIIGRAPRLEFKAPASMALEKHVVTWPKIGETSRRREEPRSRGIKVSADLRFTILELRAGRCQDVLPPSIHPEMHRPYTWLTPPKDGFPPVPDALLCLWLDFEAFSRRARNLCPWADPEPEPAPRKVAHERPHTGPSVIAAFNEAHGAIAILEAHGYKRIGRRWASPHAKASAAPGLVLLPSGSVYCHDTDDPLADQHAHDAFDLYAHFEHAGDHRAAVKAAARLLGLDSRSAA